jgi:copper homeostasis protein
MQAQKVGAKRIILCAGDTACGITPSFGNIRMARQILDAAELYVLVRPHTGDFLYSPTEQEVMLHDVKVARQLGANGVVLGCLSASGTVDMTVMKKLMNGVGEMEVTFSRAFDLCNDPMEAIDQLIELGVKRVHTSCLEANLETGLSQIKAMTEKAEGQLMIVPASGVTVENVERVADETPCREFGVDSPLARESGVEVSETSLVPDMLVELQKVNEKDAALEKMLKDAKAKKKKGRHSEDDDDF